MSKPARIVGCFLEHDGKFVILHRHKQKPNGGSWGLPAGKVEADESDTVAMVRELYEETGYKASESELVHLGDFNFGSDDNRYTFVTYKVQLNEQFPLVLESQAHKGYDWVSGKDCYAIPNLITDFHDLLRQLGYVK